MILRGNRCLRIAHTFRRDNLLICLFRHDEKVGHEPANCEYYRAY